MKRNIALIVAALATLFIAPSCGRHRSHTRLMSYNVRNCMGLDGQISYDRVADVINAAAPDAVALQELDSMTARYPEQDVLRNLAERTGMHPVFAASIDYRGGKYGIGMLTREQPLSFCRVPLPCRSEPRSLLIVELPDYYYCSTHLSLNAEDRVSDVRIIIDTLSKLTKPVFLAGDFNAERDEESMRLLAEHFTLFEKQGSYYTFPADKPDTEIDYICHYSRSRPAVQAADHRVIEAPVESDHRPIAVDIKYDRLRLSLSPTPAK